MLLVYEVVNLTWTYTMPYFQCHDCYKLVHIDTDKSETCPVCGSKNGEVLMDEEHHEAVKEGLIFHEDTD